MGNTAHKNILENVNLVILVQNIIIAIKFKTPLNLQTILKRYDYKNFTFFIFFKNRNSENLAFSFYQLKKYKKFNLSFMSLFMGSRCKALILPECERI